ncbi:hypothetical protein B9Z55_027129 [Caenorhabditis nigoni]|nr:hypothetical protein B9Z55_027129 [Caenorhabditis nigoni]
MIIATLNSEKKTGWSFQRIRSFFNARRFEHGIAAAIIPLADKEPEQILKVFERFYRYLHFELNYLGSYERYQKSANR